MDTEQVSELGWILYSTRQQDEKCLSSLLTKITGEKIGARWRVIRTSTTARNSKGQRITRMQKFMQFI